MSTIPRCIGIILDGNRRWAAARGLSKLEGHREGVRTLKNVIRWVRERGVAHLAVFLFSTENWEREPAEVAYLTDLFSESIRTHLREVAAEGVRVRFIGERSRFSREFQEGMEALERETEHNDRMTLWACLSYGGRAEIADAARKACASGEIEEDAIEASLWSTDMPDPDIIIRTGGEKRLSGFLTWKSVYSELFFLDDYWPDFSEKHLDAVLEEYDRRERRMGR